MRIRYLILVLSLLIVVSISGCISALTDVEIKTNTPDCREKTSGALGSAVATIFETTCDTMCKQERYSYKQWKCSKDDDMLVCVCKRD